MNSSQNRISMSSGAYRVFHHEVLKHAQALRESLAIGKKGSDLSELSDRFHRIKGGAGFFGLDSLSKVASDLEQVLLSPIDEVSQAIKSLQALAEQLETAMQTMPNPEGADTKSREPAKEK